MKGCWTPIRISIFVAMSKFLKKFKSYSGCIPPGVQLPKIKIDTKHYKDLGISPTTSNYDFLRALCHKGVKEHQINLLANKNDYYIRTKEELEILESLGFIDYILLNWDILNFCHSNSIPTGPGRGSAAGSLVLYLIGVTKIDPIKHDLFFHKANLYFLILVPFLLEL